MKLFQESDDSDKILDTILIGMHKVSVEKLEAFASNIDEQLFKDLFESHKELIGEFTMGIVVNNMYETKIRKTFKPDSTVRIAAMLFALGFAHGRDAAVSLDEEIWVKDDNNE